MTRWMKLLVMLGLCAAMINLQGCSNTHATMKNKLGEDVMLLGHDPVMYFTTGKPTYGDPAIKSSLPGRTYYFATQSNKQLFDASPDKYEPQFGGFCSSGATFGIKLGSDPTEFQIVDGKLYIFGDVLGHEAWSIDPAWNIKYGDQIWPEASVNGWRWQSLKRYANKVSWYKNTKDIRDGWAQKFPNRPMSSYDPGGMVNNLFLKDPGWRAREGFGPQPVVGFVGEDACPPACPGTVSRGFGQ